MRTRIKVALAGVATVLVGCGGGAAETLLAPTAHATMSVIGREGDMSPYNYRDELRYAGLLHEDADNAAMLGRRICGQKDMGYTARKITWLLDPDDTYYTGEQDVVLVRGAEFHFCPVYDNDREVW